MHVQDDGRRGHDRRMIDGMRAHLGLHALGHEALIVLDDHAVLLGHQEPGRPVLPQRPRHRDGDAGGRDRPLDRRQHRQLFGGSVLREGGGEGLLGQIDQPMIVGRELGRLRMRLGAVEHVRDRLALVRSQGGDVDERLHLLAARRRNHGAGVGVAGEDDWPRDPFQRAIERRHVVVERGQRQRRRRHLEAVGRQRPDDLRPARSVGPGAMDEHNARILEGIANSPASNDQRDATAAPARTGCVCRRGVFENR